MRHLKPRIPVGFCLTAEPRTYNPKGIRSDRPASHRARIEGSQTTTSEIIPSQSQRDYVLQPRVASLRATLGLRRRSSTTLKGLRQIPSTRRFMKCFDLQRSGIGTMDLVHQRTLPSCSLSPRERAGVRGKESFANPPFTSLRRPSCTIPESAVII
jgi:hypothetical protein